MRGHAHCGEESSSIEFDQFYGSDLILQIKGVYQYILSHHLNIKCHDMELEMLRLQDG